MKKLSLSSLNFNESDLLSSFEKKLIYGGFNQCPPWDYACLCEAFISAGGSARECCGPGDDACNDNP